MQTEIEYEYMKERLQQLQLNKELLDIAANNLIITPRVQLSFSSEEIDEIKNVVKERFKPDIIAIDPLRNIFNSSEYGNENDNSAMLFFLQKTLERLRNVINPDSGIILTHHTKKLSKKMLEEDPFQGLSGAGSLRGFYSTGMVMFAHDEESTVRQIVFELRNGERVASKLVNKINGRWKDKELIINEKEAKLVKHIFERYIELKSMAELARELNSQGYRTKSGIFKKATVRRIITNPIYMGKIRHYDKQYEGKHEAIIKEEKWQKAQELIKNQPYRKAKYEEALLKGIIKCKSCNVNMTLTYSKKENKRYRYYVCNNHLRGKGCESENRNVIAGEVEKEVMKRAERLYGNGENLSFREQKEVMKKLIKGVMVKEDGIEVCSDDKVEFIPIKKKGNKCTVVEPEGKTNNALLKAVVRAHLWKRQLEEGKYESVKELSAKVNIGTRRIQQILRLNYLAPKIKEDIINGRQPSNLRLANLKGMFKKVCQTEKKVIN